MGVLDRDLKMSGRLRKEFEKIRRDSKAEIRISGLIEHALEHLRDKIGADITVLQDIRDMGAYKRVTGILIDEKAKDLKLDNKVTFVTGASSGIGRSTALLMGTEKCKVVLMSRNANRLQQVSKEIKKSGGEALVIVGDVTNESDCENAISKRAFC